jgi:hypothetical protein
VEFRGGCVDGASRVLNLIDERHKSAVGLALTRPSAQQMLSTLGSRPKFTKIWRGLFGLLPH